MHYRYRLIFLCGIFFLLYAFPVTAYGASEILVPQASGETVLGGDPVTVDISHTDQGYIMARYTGSSAKANIQITGPDGINYKYFIGSSDSYTAFPLTSGSGSYQIDAYENLVDTKYISLFKETIEVSLSDELLPYLYPNQYVYFTADMEAVKTAEKTAGKAEDDLTAVADIYHYVIDHITYDEEKAASVQPGYLPDIDSTLETGTGICFDYASLTAASGFPPNWRSAIPERSIIPGSASTPKKPAGSTRSLNLPEMPGPVWIPPLQPETETAKKF